MTTMTTTTRVDVFDGNPPYTDLQSRVITILPAVTAIPSWIGSGLIVYVILTERRSLLKKTYHRLMLGLSLFDGVYSLGFTLFGGTWNIPREAAFVIPTARAPNFTACTVSGVFALASLGSTLYTMCLMVYYILTIHYNYADDRIARRVEPWMHLGSVVVPIVLALWDAVHEELNPTVLTPGMCLPGAFPPFCNRRDDIECTRGTDADVDLYLKLNLAALCLIVVAMLTLIHKVHETEQKMRRYAGGRLTQHALKQTRSTTIRALMYVVAYLLYSVPLFAVFGAQWGDDLPDTLQSRSRQQFLWTLVLLANIFSVNQGLWNAIIYLKPNFVSLTTEPGRALVWLAPVTRYFQQFPACVQFWSCQSCHCCCIATVGASEHDNAVFIVNGTTRADRGTVTTTGTVGQDKQKKQSTSSSSSMRDVAPTVAMTTVMDDHHPDGDYATNDNMHHVVGEGAEDAEKLSTKEDELVVVDCENPQLELHQDE